MTNKIKEEKTTEERITIMAKTQEVLSALGLTGQQQYDYLLRLLEDTRNETKQKMIEKIDKELRHNVIEVEIDNITYCVKDVKVMHQFLEELKEEVGK